MLRTILVATLLASTTLLAFAPNAAAVDLCDKYGVCVPPEIPPGPPGCGLNGLVVRTDCNGTVYLCTFRYMGGGDPFLIGNLVWRCEAITAQ